jgi:hypothetical protein
MQVLGKLEAGRFYRSSVTRTLEDEVVFCVVTFDGSRCQNWQVTNENGQNQAAVLIPSFYEGPGHLDGELGAVCSGTTPLPD